MPLFTTEPGARREQAKPGRGDNRAKDAKIRTPAAPLGLRQFPFAPIPWHTPVDPLHSTEFKAHTVLFFPLTAEKESVKP